MLVLFTREALTVAVDVSLPAVRVVAVLERLAAAPRRQIDHVHGK